MQCLDGLKHLLSAIVNCCDSEIYKQPRGLDSPEALARETVCMSSGIIILSISSSGIQLQHLYLLYVLFVKDEVQLNAGDTSTRCFAIFLVYVSN